MHVQCVAVTPEDMHNCKFHCVYVLLVGESIVQLSGHGSLEEQVQAAVPDWQQAFCSTSGRSNGLPSCLLISPAALGAIAMIKSFPAFNKVDAVAWADVCATLCTRVNSSTGCVADGTI